MPTPNYLPTEDELNALSIKYYSSYPDKSLLPQPIFHYNEWYFEIRKSCLQFNPSQSVTTSFNRIDEIRLGGLDYHGIWHLHNTRVRSKKELTILLWQIGFLELSYFENSPLLRNELNSWRDYTINDTIMQAAGFHKSTDNVYRRSINSSTELALEVDYDNLIEFVSYYEHQGWVDAAELALELMSRTGMYWTDEEAEKSLTEFMELRNGNIKLKIYSDDALRLALWQLKFTDIPPTNS